MLEIVSQLQGHLSEQLQSFIRILGAHLHDHELVLIIVIPPSAAVAPLVRAIEPYVDR